MAVLSKTSRSPATPLPIIGEYALTSPWSTSSAGTAMWSFAKKGGRDYFIKMFISPVLPNADSKLPPELIAKKREMCEEFYRRGKRVYDAVNKSDTGNIVLIDDFFFYKTKYYLVTEKIDNMVITSKAISERPTETKLLLLKVLSYSLRALHNNDVVHGDLKSSNILFVRKNYNVLIPKLIDFGDSFLESDPKSNIVGDVYLSPEGCALMNGEKIRLSRKSDVFSMGLLFHEFFTGELPTFDSEYDYPCEAVASGSTLTLNKGLLPGLDTLIRSMLLLYPDRRPSMDEVFESLKGLQNKTTDPHEIEPPEVESPFKRLSSSDF
ncbi:MAG: protein kinase [Clostridia bacterium]|nr:protein kinase [Clostridia bacterium]